MEAHSLREPIAQPPALVYRSPSSYMWTVSISKKLVLGGKMVVGADYKQLDVVAMFSPIYLKQQLKSRPTSDSVLLSLIVTSEA